MVPFTSTVLVSLQGRKQGPRLIISDNGPGMKPGEMSKAMEGYRIGADGVQEMRRAGLGLPLARQLVEAHGGKLEMQSEKGVGTTVIITLP